MCFTFLITGVYKCIYIILKYYVLEKEFSQEDRTSIPMTTKSSIIHFIYLLFIMTPIVANYIAFYHLIRDYFLMPDITRGTKSTVGLTYSEIKENSHEKLNENVDDFLR